MGEEMNNQKLILNTGYSSVNSNFKWTKQTQENFNKAMKKVHEIRGKK